MYWQDQEKNQKQYSIPDNIVDLSFKVKCQQLPLDHAYTLAQTIQEALPWFAGEAQAGMHLIHGAESGNGWLRPEEPDAVMSLSRRTRFMLRLPKQRVEEACQLTTQTLDVDGVALSLSEPNEKLLSPLTTIFARYVAIPNMEDSIEDEEAFLDHAASLLHEEGIQVKKMMSGREHILRMPNKNLYTRSLMIDGLEVAESVYLQQQGIGACRKFGCGLFLPHKGIDAVGEAQQK